MGLFLFCLSTEMIRRNFNRVLQSIEEFPAILHIAKAARTMAVTYIVVVAAFMSRELLMAREFGLSDQLDAFLVAYVVPLFAVSIAGPSFHSAFVPAFVRVRYQDGPRAAQLLFSNFLGCTILLLVVVTVVLAIAYPLVLPFVARGFPPAKLAMTTSLFFRLLPIIVLAGTSAAMVATLNAAGRFAIGGLVPAITPAVIAAVLVANHRTAGLFTVATAVTCGAILELVVVGFSLARAGIRPVPAFPRLSPELRNVLEQYSGLLASSAMMSMTTVVDQLMAASLGSGATSALSFGTKVVNVGLGAAAVVVGTAVMPSFAKLVAEHDWRALRETLRTSVVFILAGSLAFTVLLIVFSAPIVRVLFEGGRFHAGDTALVALVQSCFALQIPFYAAMIPLVRAISALGANHLLALGAAINLASCIALNYVFMKWLGVAGIALSTAAVYAISLLFALWALNRVLRRIERAG